MAQIPRSLDSGLVDLLIDTAKQTVTINNQDSRDALFNVRSTIDNSVVWSYLQAAGTQSKIAIPTVDNNGNPINWVVEPITNPKTGVTEQGITSPPWQLTMA